MPLKKIESVLDAKPYELNVQEKKVLFRQNLLDELIHHYNNNELYRKFCTKNNFDPNNYSSDIYYIPPIPVSVFKTLGKKLKSVASDSIKSSLESSASSGKPSTVLLDKITSRRQTKAMARVMQEVLGSKRLPFCIMDIDPSGSNSVKLGARSAAVKGYLNFASSANYFIDTISAENNASLTFLDEKFIEYLNSYNLSEPIIIFGFTYIMYHTVHKQLSEDNKVYKLPKGSKIIHIGGWKKLESEKVSKQKFNNDLSKLFGIQNKDVVDIYGFTEQMGLNYPDCPSGWKRMHAYADVIVRDEQDLTICPDGNAGLLQFLSPLQHSYPGNVVLTDDLGIVKEGVCECGHDGKCFKVLGRAKRAEVRGCGDIMSEKVNTLIKKSNKSSKSGKLRIYFSNQKISSDLSCESKMEQLMENLQTKQRWLSEQPVESLLGIINKARLSWGGNQNLSKYKNLGLNFLIDWCEPNRLRSLLDSSLNGKRGHLDNFLTREDFLHGSIKAIPRGVVSHWLSGNVPLLGMFVLIQSLLTKNSNLLKVSSSDVNVLPEILNTFKGLAYVTPGGRKISGEDILDTVGVVYFDRNNYSIANKFSESADARVAWGGREAIESVCSLPKKYDSQDIFFGPKLSIMVIGKDSFNSDKAIRKLVRRASTDASVFDQFACASPHTIFVEEGGSISAKEFAQRLSLGMQRALSRIPTKAPDIGQLNKIRSKIAEFDFFGESWSDDQYRWTVLYDEGPETVNPTYNRVITVKSIKSIFDIINYITDDIQSVGLSVSGERRLDFADKLFKKGVVRCPDVGFMTHFDSPWDGIYVIDRLVKWVTLGGPL